MISTLSAISQIVLTQNLLSNLRNRVKLEKFHSLPNQTLEELTLAIPARNEEKNLQILLTQLVDQHSKPKEILVLNDNSTDQTMEVVKSFESRLPGIRILQGEALPSGWRGKIWALNQLSREALTPYILFIDADVRFTDSCSLASLWQAYSLRSKKGMASVFPKLRGTQGSAHLLLDQVYTQLYYFLPSVRYRKIFEGGLENLIRLFPEAGFSSRIEGAVAATGQVFLASKKDLESLNPWARIRLTTHDGLKLARIFEKAGLDVHTFDGAQVFDCQMYKNFSEAFKGFSRNSFEALGESRAAVLFISGLLFWVFVVPYIFWPFFLANPFWLVAFLYFLYGQYQLASEMKLGMDHLALAPVKSASSVGVHLWGMVRSELGIKTLWKGREV